MYILICGGGFIGKGITKELVELKHDVVAIDTDIEVCEEIFAKYGAVTIQGNATDIETLESAGIDRCDVAVAVMGNDSDNLAFAMLAKHFDVPHIIVRMEDPKYEDVLKTIGIQNIANVAKFLIDQIMVNIGSPELRKVISFGDVGICNFDISEKAQCVGKTIAEIVCYEGFPRKCTITCIYDESSNTFLIPRGDYVLKPNDRVFLCGLMIDIKEAIRYLM